MSEQNRVLFNTFVILVVDLDGAQELAHLLDLLKLDLAFATVRNMLAQSVQSLSNESVLQTLVISFFTQHVA